MFRFVATPVSVFVPGSYVTVMIITSPDLGRKAPVPMPPQPAYLPPRFGDGIGPTLGLLPLGLLAINTFH